jgi:hypothetical protein
VNWPLYFGLSVGIAVVVVVPILQLRANIVPERMRILVWLSIPIVLLLGQMVAISLAMSVQ